MTTKNWVIVINNYTLEEQTYFVCFCIEKCKYAIVGFEKGKKGTPHMQCYISLHRAETMEWLKGHFPRAHLEFVKGTPQQNLDYSAKDGDYWEHGELPSQGKATWDKIEDAMANPRENPHLFNQYQKTYRKVMNMERALVKNEPRIVYVWDMSSLPEDTVSIDTYDGEDFVYVDAFSMNSNLMLLRMYRHKKSAKIRLGYEYITFNPKCVYVQTNCCDEDGDEVFL